MAASEDKKKIDAYLKKHERWNSQLNAARKVLNSTDLAETVKWGMPHYTYDKKILVGLAGFKNHCAIWFHQGVFLKDKARKLVNAQEGTTKGLRQWRFEEGDKVDTGLLKSYAVESINNHKAGKKITPAKKKLLIPKELAAALEKSARLKKNFAALTPGKQKEYAEHIGSDKQEKTRMARLEKIMLRINAGIGLYDN
ncbi:MAG: YdeI/OmpD-associated family protein [Gammaproteobacteria bacterium]|nr:YdeI/OmpD-associated family protein [Gammaproteobacteria bacterium]